MTHAAARARADTRVTRATRVAIAVVRAGRNGCGGSGRRHRGVVTLVCLCLELLELLGFQREVVVDVAAPQRLRLARVPVVVALLRALAPCPLHARSRVLTLLATCRVGAGGGGVGGVVVAGGNG